MMKKAGIKPTLVSAGKYKVEANPYEPLDKNAQGFLQSRVDDYHNAFIQAVARGRGVPVDQVRKGMGQGRVLGAKDALRSKMIDGIATPSQVATKLKSGSLSRKIAHVNEQVRSLLMLI